MCVRAAVRTAGYYGVQLPSNLDQAYYRPDVDPPRHPGILQRAVMPFTSPGLGSPLIAKGDHDALVAGLLVPSRLTRALAVGDRALWNMPTNLELPEGLKLSTGDSPDGPPDPRFVGAFVELASGRSYRPGAPRTPAAASSSSLS